MNLATFLVACCCLTVAIATNADVNLRSRAELELEGGQVFRPQLNDPSLFSNRLGNTNQVQDDGTVVLKDTTKIQGRNDIKQIRRAQPTHTHEVIFAIKQANLEIIHEKLMEISNPDSVNYGRHLTRDEVGELTSSPESTIAVHDYLRRIGASIVYETPFGEYIRATAPVSIWETEFATEFYEFELKERPGLVLHRAHSYSLPQQLSEHVLSVLNTVEFDAQNQKVHFEHSQPVSNGRTIPKSVTPALINTAYGITSNQGSTQSTQAVYETIGQKMSSVDLTAFQKYFSIPVQPISSVIGGNYVSGIACPTSDINNCAEATLDVRLLTHYLLFH